MDAEVPGRGKWMYMSKSFKYCGVSEQWKGKRA